MTLCVIIGSFTLRKQFYELSNKEEYFVRFVCK